MIPRYLSAIAEAVAPALGNHLWQSTLFAITAGLLTLVLRKNHARARYGLWLAASVKFLIPFSLLIGMGGHLAWSRGSAGINTGLYSAIEQVGRPFAQPAMSTSLRGTPATHSSSLVDLLLALLAAVWFCGCVAVIFVWYVRSRRMTASMRGASLVKSGRELEVLRRLEQSGGIARRVELIFPESVLEPGIFGISHPVLSLPMGISDRLTDAQLDAIITHELCHVRRRDNLAAAFHMLVEAIFWFHPLVWWIGARLIDERERACDEAVLSLGSDPQVYAEGILKVCEFYLESPLFCAAGVTGSNLKKRIEAIMIHRAARDLSFAKKLFLSTAGALAFLGPVVLGLLHPTKGHAQNAPFVALAFAQVSVKPNTTDTPMAGFSIKGKPFSAALFKPDRFMATNFTLHGLIRLAYGIQDSQIFGGPQWMNSEKYDVDAKMGSTAADELNKLGKDQSNLERMHMLQALLADRFKLAFHRETKEISAYTLVVADNGPKLQTAKPGDPYSNGVKGLGGRPVGTGYFEPEKGKVVFQGRPLSSLVQYLSDRLGRTVLDKTGLNATYDFALQWAPTSPESSSPSVLAAVQEQLGLKLELQNSPVEVLVIDRAEKPSENLEP
jgi:bla regulator protein BlaR1